MDKAQRRPRIVVRDLMTAHAEILHPGQSLADAARLFTHARIGGAPVVDDEGKLVGILSKTDLLERSPFIPHSPSGRVGDAMTREVLTVRGSDTAMSAIRAMTSHEIHRLVVVDDNAHPIGVLTTIDVLHAIVRGEPLQAGDASYEDREERHAEPARAILS